MEGMPYAKALAWSGNPLRAVRASRPKTTDFLFAILAIVMIIGSMMVVIEGPEYGFIKIPESMCWASSPDEVA